ncbi:MAG: DUF1501 domain-containing protein [Bacteroidales bacterium]|nr:DUF1501 domain-containing protein [Bacteroidales bacterium]
MKRNRNIISRRKFIGQSGLGLLGASALLSTVSPLRALSAAAMNPGKSGRAPYKAMVCLLLSGGNDSFNMLIPRGNAEYNEYAITRSNLAIPQNEIVPVSPLTSDGKTYGLHPGMPEMAQLFNDGKLSFISNLGTMVRPTTKEEVLNGTAELPLGLFSHADQIQQWQSGRTDERSAIGWGGRIADLMHTVNTNQNISMNISLSGSNVFENGENIIEFVIDRYGGSGIWGYGGDWTYDQVRTGAINAMLDRPYADMYRKTYINTIKKSNDANLEFNQAIEAVPDFNTAFSDTDLSQSFLMIAKTIAARETLGFERQIFFINYGSWDHHDGLIENQAVMLPEVSKALSEFSSAMEEIGTNNEVTTFSMSDFSRTLTSNGNGTDHAWGGNALVMGGAVNGQEMFGAYPSLQLGNPLDIGTGILVPTLSTDEYMAEIALWFGVDNENVSSIFPNLSNFYDINSGTPPIGFLNF